MCRQALSGFPKKGMHKIKQKINIKGKQLCIKMKKYFKHPYPDYILYLIILDFTELKLGSLLLFALQKFHYHQLLYRHGLLIIQPCISTPGSENKLPKHCKLTNVFLNLTTISTQTCGTQLVISNLLSFHSVVHRLNNNKLLSLWCSYIWLT